MDTECGILFGAGASYGCEGTLPGRVPLGKDLVECLVWSYPGSWGCMHEDLAREFRGDFESGMSHLWAFYPNAVQEARPGYPSPHQLMREMALYFTLFELAPGQCDTYSQLLSRLPRSDRRLGVWLSTLNYEHLLERAMERLQLAPRVLRPHGG